MEDASKILSHRLALMLGEEIIRRMSAEVERDILHQQRAAEQQEPKKSPEVG